MAKNSMNKKEFLNETKINKFHGTWSASRIQNNDALHAAYITALETIHNLQSTGGSLFLGDARFKMQAEILTEIKGDHTNIQKGCEDALNKIAWFDDQQNRYLDERPPWCEDLD